MSEIMSDVSLEISHMCVKVHQEKSCNGWWRQYVLDIVSVQKKKEKKKELRGSLVCENIAPPEKYEKMDNETNRRRNCSRSKVAAWRVLDFAVEGDNSRRRKNGG
jgi:hypothetical protein